MASIRRRGDKWQVQICEGGIRLSRTLATKREARAWAAAKAVELREQSAMPPGDRYTFADVIRRYVSNVVPYKRGKKWELVRAESIPAHPAFPRDMAIGQIRVEHLSVWRDARRREVKDGTVLREFSFLSAVFEYARRDLGLIDRNPCHDTRRPPQPPHRDRIIRPDEIKVLLRAMNYSYKRSLRTVTSALAVCFLLALRSGMRAGELRALEWSNVHAVGYCYLPVTKTRPRKVPLTSKAMLLIERMRGWDDKYVFGLSAETLDALFRKYVKLAGLDGFTFRDSRHTAATWIAGKMKADNLPPLQAISDLCSMFGWTNINQALTYLNPTPAEIARRIR